MKSFKIKSKNLAMGFAIVLTMIMLTLTFAGCGDDDEATDMYRVDTIDVYATAEDNAQDVKIVLNKVVIDVWAEEEHATLVDFASLGGIVLVDSEKSNPICATRDNPYSFNSTTSKKNKFEANKINGDSNDGSIFEEFKAYFTINGSSYSKDISWDGRGTHCRVDDNEVKGLFDVEGYSISFIFHCSKI